MSTRFTGRVISTMAVAAAAMTLAGCFSMGGPTQDERAAQLAAELESGGLGVSQAEVSYQDSFSGDLTVTVTLEDSVIEPGLSVSAQTLGPILGVMARGAENMRVGAAGFYAQDADGVDVSMVTAATDLGIGDAVRGRSLSLSGAKLEQLSK
ncbi:hypothetical protein AB6V29_01795 [Microbacterium sp. 20-116]|uniref:hypothetical protein n=1 Tax=unclassified Microbacterium TaxID=2609290 RepID=UPI00226F3B92|nr:hypothetical protein [Microbacterium sp. SL75]WAC68794.1 hypothetical protein OVA17_14565 [Microbacterium sp. SL75]